MIESVASDTPALPWEHLVNEERDGTWAGFGAWEEWLAARMPADAGDGYESADDCGAWKENLYAIVAGLLLPRGAA